MPRHATFPRREHRTGVAPPAVPYLDRRVFATLTKAEQMLAYLLLRRGRVAAAVLARLAGVHEVRPYLAQALQQGYVAGSTPYGYTLTPRGRAFYATHLPQALVGARVPSLTLVPRRQEPI